MHEYAWLWRIFLPFNPWTATDKDYLPCPQQADLTVWILQGLDSLTPKQKNAVDAFVGQVLNGQLTDAQLKNIWTDGRTEYYIEVDRAVRHFFQQIRQTSDSGPVSKQTSKF